MFSDIQRGLIVPIIFIFQSIIFFIMYKIGKKPILGTKSFGDRMELLYSFAAAFLLGQFFFQALPNATGPSGSQLSVMISAFIMIGFFIMLCIQKCSRVSHQTNYTSPELNCIDIRTIVNLKSMEYTDYFFVDDLESEQFAEDTTTLNDEKAELKRRQRICVFTILTLMFLCIMEGFFLIYKERIITIGGPWTIFIFFIVDKLCETFIISISMLHAFFHAKRSTYIAWSIVWIITCILSTIPLLSSMEWSQSFEMTNHIATSIFYALAGGFLFWISLYFIWIDKKRVDKRDTIIRLVVFGITATLAWTVGYFV